jgi:Uma2 family endonuclease
VLPEREPGRDNTTAVIRLFCARDLSMPPTRKAPAFETIAELLRQLGGVSPKRVRCQPLPGQATERDLIRLNDRGPKLYELVEGTLVEKVMGRGESYLASELIWWLRSFLQQHDLGFLAGEAGAARLMPKLVRVPDVSFISWERLPVRGVVPMDPVGEAIPDLAVEVLSPSNTRGEMLRKRKEYFLAGVRLLWVVDPFRRTVSVFTSPEDVVELSEKDTLDGGAVLPGFRLPLKDLFARIPAAPARPKRPRRKRRA